MALLGREYESSDEGGSSPPTKSHNATTTTPVVAAPEVSLDDPMRLQMMLAQPTDTTLTYNVPYADLSRPEQGPAHPFKNADGNALKRKNVLTGRAEEVYISNSTFAANHNSYQSVKGYAKNPNGVGADIGNGAQGYGNLDMVPSKERSKELRAKRQKIGDPSIVEGEGRYLGPWRRYQDEDRLYEDEAAIAGEELASDEEYIEDAIEPVPAIAAPLATDYQEDIANAPTTEWHGSEERLRDYQGRSFMYTPRRESEIVKNYIPKKLIHTWKYHTKAINALRFFPKSGHLLLAASADAKISLSDTGFDRELLRTYVGHSKSVSDADFSPDGAEFLSSGYDRKVLLWDTETGQTKQKFGNGKIPHVIKFNPSQPHEFLAGMSDNTILQFDCRSSEIINTYDHHLGAINTLTFIDASRRFYSTADDRAAMVWEYGIGVPIKRIVEPYMFSLTRACPHPNGKSVAFQSGDNQIVVYSSTDRFRQNRKKAFKGHHTAGYAIDVSVSPDGAFVMSGDAGGGVCFWDWRSCEGFSGMRLRGGEGAVTCAQWNPGETSKVVTAGVEGAVKYWD